MSVLIIGKSLTQPMVNLSVVQLPHLMYKFTESKESLNVTFSLRRKSTLI